MMIKAVCIGAIVASLIAPVSAATLRLESLSAFANLSSDAGLLEDFGSISDTASAFVFEPGTSTFAEVIGTDGKVRVRAFDSPIGSNDASARGVLRATFFVDGGGFVAPEGFLNATFDTTFSRTLDPIGNHFSQTSARHRVLVTRGPFSGGSAFTATTDFSLLPTRREGDDGVSGDANYRVEASADSLRSTYRSAAGLFAEGDRFTFEFLVLSTANASGSGFADSDSSNTLQIGLELPEGVTLDSGNLDLSWVNGPTQVVVDPTPLAPVPLPAGFSLLLLSILSLVYYRGRPSDC